MNIKTAVLSVLLALPMMTNAEVYNKNDLGLDSFLTNKGFNKISYSKLPTQHAVIHASINGVTGFFIIDSGASHTIIHEASLEKFKLKKINGVDQETGTGAGGVVAISQYQLNSFNLKGIDINVAKITGMDLSHVVDAIKETSDKHIDGLIGQDVLGAHHAIIDVASDFIYLQK